MGETDGFDLERFERHVYRRDLQAAGADLLALLALLNRHLGVYSPWLAAEADDDHTTNRLAAAVATLLADPALALGPAAFRLCIAHYRWIAALFGASAFDHADHALATQPAPANSRDLAKTLLLHTPDSAIELDLDALWPIDRAMVASFCLGLLSARFCGSPAAHARREAVLRWLPDRLGEIDDIGQLPGSILHDAYMHCSYGHSRERHHLKRAINHLFRTKLEALGLADLGPPPPRPRPVMLVVLEWFSASHSIFRTHSRTLVAARDSFDLIGVATPAAIDAAGRAVFHRFVDLPPEADPLAAVAAVRRLATEIRPDILYMPSVGMSLHTIALSNLRLAPLQIAALGHPATTHSDKIDAISVEADFVGDPACFSEPLMLLPADGQPYIQSAAMPAMVPRRPSPRPEIHIAVAATAMKINPFFLNACAALADASRRPLRFHFLSAFGLGVVGRQIAKALAASLGRRAVCHGQVAFADYMAVLDDCDLFLSPFPFGNTNGIVDALTVGLPGVCLTGPEVFETIDGSLFARAGLPGWLTADTPAAYVRAALRLVADDAERIRLHHLLIDEARVERLFHGDADAFARRVLDRMRH